MAATFMPGPWSAETRDYDATWAIVDQNGDHIASVPNPYEHLGDRDDLVAEAAPATEATARLIAAAPELYAALESMKDAAVYLSACTANKALASVAESRFAAALTQARAALALTRGEAS